MTHLIACAGSLVLDRFSLDSTRTLEKNCFHVWGIFVSLACFLEENGLPDTSSSSRCCTDPRTIAFISCKNDGMLFKGKQQAAGM